MAIPYLIGYSIKPASVNSLGMVTFTDGTNDVTPNQQQCEAYGYTYNQSTGTCSAFTFSTSLGRNISNETNKLQGAGNQVETGTNNTTITGENNTVKGLSRNNIIIGSNNEISNGVNNTFVYGNLANSTANNSIVLGGNAEGDILGERQYTTLMYGGQTTDGSIAFTYLNNVIDSFFQPSVDINNSIFFFQSETIAVRTGGVAAGTAGDYVAWVERGVVKNGRTVLSIDRTIVEISSSGTTAGWDIESKVQGSDFYQEIQGVVDMTIEWASTIRITEIRTTSTLY